jgi:hypothetical protein
MSTHHRARILDFLETLRILRDSRGGDVSSVAKKIYGHPRARRASFDTLQWDVALNAFVGAIGTRLHSKIVQ